MKTWNLLVMWQGGTWTAYENLNREELQRRTNDLTDFESFSGFTVQEVRK